LLDKISVREPNFVDFLHLIHYYVVGLGFNSIITQIYHFNLEIREGVTSVGSILFITVDESVRFIEKKFLSVHIRPSNVFGDARL